VILATEDYASGEVISIVVAVALGALALMATATGVYKHLGIALLGACGAWAAGALFEPQWLAFALVFAVFESHQVSWVLWRRHMGAVGRERGDPIRDGDARVVEAATDRAVAGPPVIEVISRADEYQRAVESAELGAERVDKTLVRLNTVFKGRDYAAEVAKQRYGANSPTYRVYVESHERRRHEFFGKLRQGTLQQRELCPLDGLVEAILSPAHPGVSQLDHQIVVKQVREVIATLRDYPDGYSLALSPERQPFRYGIYDSDLVVIHEAIGSADIYRVNSLFIREPAAVKVFQDDFDLLWERTPLELRENEAVAARLEGILGSAQADLTESSR
jgi:hypothetical protein